MSDEGVKVADARQRVSVGIHPRDFEVRTVRVVGDQPLLFAAAYHVVNVVFDTGFAPPEDFELALGVVHVEYPVLRSQRGADRDDEVFFTTRGTHADAEALICLSKDADVVALRGTDLVTPDSIRAPGVVDFLVENVVFAGPGGAVEDIGQVVIEKLACL